MASVFTLFSTTSSFSSSSAQFQPTNSGKNGGAAVYVTAVPLRAAAGPAQSLVSVAYSIGLWELQHFMVLVKPNPSFDQAYVYDFQPQNPENFLVALTALSGGEVPGIVLKRKVKRIPRTRCWFVGYSRSYGLDVADKFNEEWPTNLILGKHDCRDYTNGSGRMFLQAGFLQGLMKFNYFSLA